MTAPDFPTSLLPRAARVAAAIVAVALLAVPVGAQRAQRAQRDRAAARPAAARPRASVPPVGPAAVAAAAAGAPAVDTLHYRALRYRMIGPFRGGRSTAVAGIAEEPHTFYQGSTGGGLWKTVDAGASWQNVSDGHFGGSVGAVDVADSDPNVIYVGTGSADIRGNSSPGHGMWKSVDGGKSWAYVGLPEAGQIARVVVHPRDPNTVQVAALGHAFGKNPERGIYRTADGGRTWKQVLFLDDSTGASDIAMSPRNPRVLYAGMWRASASRGRWSRAAPPGACTRASTVATRGRSSAAGSPPGSSARWA
jgi:hypothetical protein